MERLRAAGIQDLAVLQAFDAVPRHLFVPSALGSRAYEDVALPIGHGQTISRPSVHARFLELARLTGRERVLEIGTGSGFQTALLTLLAREVYSVERLPSLAAEAAKRLSGFGCRVALRTGDGSRGWPENAPFDVILVSAATRRIPEALCLQLAEEGRLLVPVGTETRQEVHRIRRAGGAWVRERAAVARFVPLVSTDAPSTSESRTRSHDEGSGKGRGG